MRTLVKLVVPFMLAAGLASAQLTTVQGTITRADSSTPSGYATIQWQNFTTATGGIVPAGSLNLSITNGYVNVSLQNNLNASPSGTSYTLTYHLNSIPVYIRKWYIPYSPTPVSLASVEFPPSGLAGSTAQIALGQLITTGAVLGQCITFNGYLYLPGSCGGGGGSSAFSAITGGTNTTAAMVVGTGASMDYSGSGTIDANKLLGTAITLSGSGGKLLQTAGSLPNGDLLSSTSGNAVDSGIALANVMQTGTAATCSQLPALTGDVISTAGSCATTVTKIGGVAFGTAATANTGATGHNLFFGDGTNTWTGNNTFGLLTATQLRLYNSLLGNSFTALGTLSDGVNVNLRVGDNFQEVDFSIPRVVVLSDFNAHAAVRSVPYRTGTGSPVARDACTNIGEMYFRTDAPVVGQNTFGCTTPGTPGTWTLQGGPGTGTVTNTAGSLAAGALVVGNAGSDVTILGSLGTSTSVLHGNAGGSPAFSAVVLTTDVSGVLPSVNGGLGTSAIVFSGPSGGAKTFTLPNVSSTILTTNAAVTLAQGGTGADLSAIAKGGIITGTGAATVGITAVGTNGQVLSADSTQAGGVKWVAAGASGTVTSIATTGPITGGTITTSGTIACATCTTSAAALTLNNLIIGAGSQGAAALGSLGTTVNVLHGNSGGPPAFGPVALATDVSGTLPVGNGGTGLTGGTSGGVPYFSGAATLASSAALAIHGVVVGGGAGGAPTSTATGTAGQILTSNGASADPTFQAAPASIIGGWGQPGVSGLYAGLYGANYVSSSFSATDGTPIARATTIENLYVKLDAAYACTATVYKNGSPTSLSVNITSGTTGSDTSHTVSFAAGDLFSILLTSSSGNVVYFTVTAI